MSATADLQINPGYSGDSSSVPEGVENPSSPGRATSPKTKASGSDAIDGDKIEKPTDQAGAPNISPSSATVSSTMPVTKSTVHKTTTSSPMLRLPVSAPFYGHNKIIIDNRYLTFKSHECDKIFNCPLIPPGTPNESRDTATRNHRSRHSIAKNWGVQLETLLRRAEDDMVLPPKYAKHLLSNFALLSSRVQDSELALQLLVKQYREHRATGDMAPLRVQDVKNTLEALDRETVRETRSVTAMGSGNTQSEESTPPVTTPVTRTRTVQFVTPNPMPPPPTPSPSSKRTKYKYPSRQTRAEKFEQTNSSPSPSPEDKEDNKGEFVVPPLPTHSRNTRAAGTKDSGESDAPRTYFLPADPEPPRKKRSFGPSRTPKAVNFSRTAAPVRVACEHEHVEAQSGMVGGVRMWNGKKIFDHDIVDIAADYFTWQRADMDLGECRRQIEEGRQEELEWLIQQQVRQQQLQEQEEQEQQQEKQQQQQEKQQQQQQQQARQSSPVEGLAEGVDRDTKANITSGPDDMGVICTTETEAETNDNVQQPQQQQQHARQSSPASADQQAEGQIVTEAKAHPTSEMESSETNEDVDSDGDIQMGGNTDDDASSSRPSTAISQASETVNESIEMDPAHSPKPATGVPFQPTVIPTPEAEPELPASAVTGPAPLAAAAPDTTTTAPGAAAAAAAPETPHPETATDEVNATTTPPGSESIVSRRESQSPQSDMDTMDMDTDTTTTTTTTTTNTTTPTTTNPTPAAATASFSTISPAPSPSAAGPPHSDSDTAAASVPAPTPTPAPAPAPMPAPVPVPVAAPKQGPLAGVLSRLGFTTSATVPTAVVTPVQMPVQHQHGTGQGQGVGVGVGGATGPGKATAACSECYI